jgi:hypothetical protein
MHDWLAGLLQAANAKAELVARALGVTEMGVHAFREERWDPDRGPDNGATRGGARPSRRSTAERRAGFDMALGAGSALRMRHCAWSAQRSSIHVDPLL